MKFCIVSLHLYPFVVGQSKNEKIGGAELQQAMLAKALVKKGVDVTVITLDYGQRNFTEYEGIKIIGTFKENKGISGLRFFYPRLYKLVMALFRADADIYYVRCAGYLTGIVAIFSKLLRRKVIFAGGHDTDFIVDKYLINLKRDKWLHEIGLRLVNQIIVQSNQQLKYLKENFQRNAQLIRNFSVLPSCEIPLNDRKIILWVATIREWKRPMIFLELAMHYPDKQFVMIGGVDINNRGLYKDVEKAASKIKNLVFKGFQPIEETEKYFDKCEVFVNTSEHEGFPNTFIQAWRRGIPCLTFFDPDNVVKNYSLGVVALSKEDFLERLIDAQKIGKRYSKQIIKYYLQNHSELVVDKYLELFKSMCG